MRLLDLFCGAGGCSMGYYRAGFGVVGVDIKDQRRHPFEFHRLDAMEVLDSPRFLRQFDAIHASPPCQRYSVLRHANERKGSDAPDYVAEVRRLLRRTGLPFVIENVVGAPLHRPVGLCGSMFDLGSNGRYLQRHRLFEVNFPLKAPGRCRHRGEAVGVYGHGSWDNNKLTEEGRYTFGYGENGDRGFRRGGYQGTKAEKMEAMDIDWMTDLELGQAIPPAYTEWIGKAMMQHLRR